MSERIRSWSVEYLLDYQATSSAIQDKNVHDHYRHDEVVMGSSKVEVIRSLREKGAIVISIKEKQPPHPLLNRVTNDYRQQFLMALMFNVEGGVSPGKALEMLIEQEKGPIRSRLNIGLSILRQGRSFLEAIRSMDLFDETTLAIIEAGEEMGKLAQSLRTAYAHLEKSNTAGKLIVGVVFMTSFDLVFAIVSIMGTRFGMIPSIREQGSSAEDPAKQEAFLRALDQATLANDVMIGITFLAMFALLLCFVGYFGRDESFRKKVDEFLLKVPLLKDLLAHAAISSTSSVMSSLLRGGVTFMPAAQITARGTKMDLVKSYWLRSHDQVEMGESVGRSLAKAPLTPNEQMIVQSHKDVNQLASTFELISNQRDEQAKKAAKKFAGTVFILSLLYSGISVGVTLFVVYVQNQGVFGG